MKINESAEILRKAIETFRPTHIVSMVSGGKDSAASDQVAEELGIKIDLRIHGFTRTGIKETTDHCRDIYGRKGEYVEADAGTAYEDYVLRKGFFGKGHGAHGFAYRVLKATPFRKAVSHTIRHGKRNVRVLLINGARKDESENRQKNLEIWRQDPAQKNNIWVNIIHDWTEEDRDQYLESRGTPINPVAIQLCRSGECMCGTMQSKQERAEAAALYPNWGSWIADLEREAIALHGYGWGEDFPKQRKIRHSDEFTPACKGCLRRGASK
ncbi:phosphoadenosine phosphosulfate reductase family protein [Agrobacterium vitis]|uniref:phosphoadenosine phosphosulfate reductase domain-containing protein n=1 Tax=Agrobacterium vitis TaxID=373 RepID=UPI0012E90BDC|nr:phosphoadenosine phosphosulfate reductase family protein [Agrobacterium vitis]MVA32638.1 phosphoadenosine phosphosulfate reductase family protein [Agrobacterium vitis]